MPEVSIITPVYANTPQKVAWLREAVESVRSQPFSDWEMIVVDDCSDLALELPDDDRVRRVRTTRRYGPAASRNTAVALAEANALLPLDADDMLAEDALGRMYEAWRADPTRVVYGNLQKLEQTASGFQVGKVVNLPDYTFELSLKLTGIIPVTAMHSTECHERAGGWKPELEHGLEDVEYWISAGKAGFCGLHLPELTLYYRRHESSRFYSLRHVRHLESDMRKKIRERHADVYGGGVYPMGCCGGGSSSAPPPASKASPQVTTLDQYPASEKVWVQYVGRRQASFGMVGTFTDISYQILGPGHKFEVHVKDTGRFARSGRGNDFKVSVPPPDGLTAPAPEAQAAAEPAYRPPAPELAQIERLDPVAALARTHMPQAVTEGPRTRGDGPRPLDALELGALQDVLEMESWTVETLAAAEPDELTGYKGVGPKRAEQIIKRAQELTRGQS